MKLTFSNANAAFEPGMLVRIEGHDQSQCIYEIDGCTLSFAPWTWIARVISWNPCNELRFALGVWE